jgi:hypothetical protein
MTTSSSLYVLHDVNRTCWLRRNASVELHHRSVWDSFFFLCFPVWNRTLVVHFLASHFTVWANPAYVRGNFRDLKRHVFLWAFAVCTHLQQFRWLVRFHATASEILFCFITDIKITLSYTQRYTEVMWRIVSENKDRQSVKSDIVSNFYLLAPCWRRLLPCNVTMVSE